MTRYDVNGADRTNWFEEQIISQTHDSSVRGGHKIPLKYVVLLMIIKVMELKCVARALVCRLEAKRSQSQRKTDPSCQRWVLLNVDIVSTARRLWFDTQVRTKNTALLSKLTEFAGFCFCNTNPRKQFRAPLPEGIWMIVVWSIIQNAQKIECYFSVTFCTCLQFSYRK